LTLSCQLLPQIATHELVRVIVTLCCGAVASLTAWFGAGRVLDDRARQDLADRWAEAELCLVGPGMSSGARPSGRLRAIAMAPSAAKSGWPERCATAAAALDAALAAPPIYAELADVPRLTPALSLAADARAAAVDGVWEALRGAKLPAGRPGRVEPPPAAPEEPRSPAAESQTFRVMTYNVHSCVGMDGKVSPSRIARIIARHRPDIVSLQELDVGRPRTGRVDQAARIGEKLGMQCCFHPALRIGDGQYGNAILSRDAMRLVKADWLPRLRAQRPFQPRAALWVAVERSGYALQVINAHLSLWPKERLLQVEALLGDEWLGHADCRPPVVLCGDFNATPGSSVCRRLGRRLLDAQRVLAAHRPLRTWSGRYPTHRIDHVFVGPRIEVVSIEVPNTELEKIASDHLPVIVEVRIVEHAAPGGSGLARNTNGQARQPGRTGK